MVPEFITIRTFLIGFCIGTVLCIVLFGASRSPSIVPYEYFEFPKDDKFNNVGLIQIKDYNIWFRETGFTKHLIDNDELRYSETPKVDVESQFLFREIPVLCVVFTTNHKNAKAINDTWSNSCNHILYYSKNSESDKPNVRAPKTSATSSFHLLCDVIRKIVTDYSDIKWAIFVKDDMMVIPENLRHLVAPLNPLEGHYLGHPINFWGVDYNIAIAGFVLSRGAMERLHAKFPNTQACISGGKYWKQEDLYLGKHLRSMNIIPQDTRDQYGYTAFLGLDLDKMMFPGSMIAFANYYKRALYPVKCCGPKIITFPILSSTEIYKYHYMIYTMRVFLQGQRGNRPAATVIPESQVWQDFLRERGLPLNSSASDYEKNWYIKFDNVTAFPGLEKFHELKERQKVGGPDALFNPTNMPEVLLDMLTNYTAGKALKEN